MLDVEIKSFTMFGFLSISLSSNQSVFTSRSSICVDPLVVIGTDNFPLLLALFMCQLHAMLFLVCRFNWWYFFLAPRVKMCLFRIAYSTFANINLPLELVKLIVIDIDHPIKWVFSPSWSGLFEFARTATILRYSRYVSRPWISSRWRLMNCFRWLVLCTL